MTTSIVQDRIDADVARFGRSVIGVFPPADDPDPVNSAFAYTVGNAALDPPLPELLVVGMFGADAQWLLNALSSVMIERRAPFGEAEIVDLGGKVPALVVAAGDEVKDLYTIQATAWHGRRDYRVMQAVVPDGEGRFPGQPGCAEPYSKVVVRRTAAVN